MIEISQQATYKETTRRDVITYLRGCRINDTKKLLICDQRMSQDENDMSIDKVVKVTLNCTDPYKWQKKYAKNRYASDPEYRARVAAKRSDYHRKKADSDPEYVQKRRDYAAACYARKKANQGEASIVKQSGGQ